jgi:hypothetical protein
MEEMEEIVRDLAAEVVPEVGWRWRGYYGAGTMGSLYHNFHWWYWRYSSFTLRWSRWKR